jgi:hypothetical protein
MERHCPNCHQLLDRVATTCPACSLDLAPRLEVVAPVEIDLEREHVDLLAAVVALGEPDGHRPPPWQASVPLPVRPDLDAFIDLEADVLPEPRHRRLFVR